MAPYCLDTLFHIGSFRYGMLLANLYGYLIYYMLNCEIFPLFISISSRIDASSQGVFCNNTRFHLI